MKELLKKRLCLLLLLTLLMEPLGSTIHHRKSKHYTKSKSHSKHRNTKRQNSSRSIQLEFRPQETTNKKSKKSRTETFKLNKFASKNNRKLKQLLKEENLVRLAQKIQNQAKKKHLKIKRVLLGKEVKSKLNDKRLEKKLSKLLSKKSLKSKMKSLKKRIKKASLQKHKRKKKRSLKKNKNQPQIQPINMTNRNLVGMPSSSSSSKKGKDDEMGFNFMPGFSGMPFPPFMMNGPHFHPPLNMTVNALPYPNLRTAIPPSVIAEKNFKEDQDMMAPILDKIKELSKKIQSASNETNINLESKLQTMITKM
jgi:DNA polymerase III alpha subunit (gram-positive type)